MIITNNDLNSMPQQVEENKNNIKILANYLKEAYKTSNDLGDSAVSIAISDTNATADTIDGWLISHDGYLYHITSGDGTNLLLEYYTNLRGVKGDTGGTVKVEANPITTPSSPILHSIDIDNVDYRINYIEDIIDNSGHDRFIEGNINMENVTGVNITYSKWSLSGTHLMIVISGTIDANTTLYDNTNIGKITLPNWLLNKIYPTVDTKIMDNIITFYKTNASWVTTTHPIALAKTSTHLSIGNGSGDKSFSDDYSFRMQYDLLIDNE